MIKLLKTIEKPINAEVRRRMNVELCRKKYELEYSVNYRIGLYYMTFGEEIDQFNWHGINLESISELERALAPISRHRVLKLIKCATVLGADSISFATYLLLCKRLQPELYATFDVPYKLDILLEGDCNGDS